MSEPILRVPLSEAEAHHKQLADALQHVENLRAGEQAADAEIERLRARVAELEAELAKPLPPEHPVSPVNGSTITAYLPDDVKEALDAVSLAVHRHMAATGTAKTWREMLVAGAEALWARVDAAEARMAAVNADAGVLTVQDLREVLLDEANEDSGVVRSCLEWTGDGEADEKGDVDVVDSIRELCGRVRHLAEQLEDARSRPVLVDHDDTEKRVGALRAELQARNAADAAADSRPVRFSVEHSTGGSHLAAETVAEAEASIVAMWGRLLAQKPAPKKLRAAIDGRAVVVVDGKVVDAPAKRPTPYLDATIDKLHGDHVVTRRDAHGRRYLGVDGTWDEIGKAKVFVGADAAGVAKPRGALVWSLAAMQQLLDKDAASEAKKLADKQSSTSTEPAWAPDFGRLHYLEGLERNGTLMDGERADLEAIRKGERCAKCGHITHEPGVGGCDGGVVDEVRGVA